MRFVGTPTNTHIYVAVPSDLTKLLCGRITLITAVAEVPNLTITVTATPFYGLTRYHMFIYLPGLCFTKTKIAP